MVKKLHINCDLGEGMADDAKLITLVSAANISCGAHAGDEYTMRAAMRHAKQHGVVVGAHPSFPDRENFGREVMDMSESELEEALVAQLQQFCHLAMDEGVSVEYVKPHGALYNEAIWDDDIAKVLTRVMSSITIDAVMTLPHGSLHKRALAEGFTVIQEGFLDRNYHSDGTLVSRSQHNAMLTSPEDVVRRILHHDRTGQISSVEGLNVSLPVDSWCIHGDGPMALDILQRLHEELKSQGFQFS